MTLVQWGRMELSRISTHLSPGFKPHKVGGVTQDTKEREATPTAAYWVRQWLCPQPISCVQNVGQIQSLFSFGPHEDDCRVALAPPAACDQLITVAVQLCLSLPQASFFSLFFLSEGTLCRNCRLLFANVHFWLCVHHFCPFLLDAYCLESNTWLLPF